ncbi:Ent-kaurene synthase [Pleomassaria siparia CBS 279.74]|uniref:Ent-kaurene synthase n=1 Tax=Pleomassaria siparia CBS 279.74 TaxID=1314801 RepID=A0A6G1K144_9PLEO|nr:Ent-kaurene synthase [Pleomassaria siparia CBS 279.74]
MDVSSDQNILASAQSLVHEIALSVRHPDGLGAFTPAIYDTAWLSMIVKETNGSKRLLFPKCFTYLLEQQQEDGSWLCYASPIDGILNSLAALLSLIKYSRHDFCSVIERSLLEPHIEKAKDAVIKMLSEWDVENTVHVGFELLVPSLLEQLEKYDATFEFPQRDRLARLHLRKISKFPVEILYGTKMSTLLHSIEAFVGKIDFDRVHHHLTHGSMFGSPSATAAYLMYTSNWDERAEDYLMRVDRSTHSSGIPSAFPTSVFESSWAFSTLLANGFDKSEFPKEHRQPILDLLLQSLEDQKGVVGFAPGLLPDADDTAVSILTLRQNDLNYDLTSLLNVFSAKDHVRTYEFESGPSFSANCNVLIALLHSDDVNKHMENVVKSVEFLITAAESGLVTDKWNVSPTYSSMLLVRALMGTLQQWDKGKLSRLSKEMIYFRIPAILCHTLVQLLKTQEGNNSWGDSAERTAYALVAIAHSLKAPWHPDLRRCATTALENGRKFMQDVPEVDLNTPSHTWIEKVTYGTPFLSKAYILAAMRSPISRQEWSNNICAIFEFSQTQLSKMNHLLGKTPLFAKESATSISLSLIESSFYLKRLHHETTGLDFFPAHSEASNKYKGIIPITWVGCNHLNGSIMTPHQIWDMMILSDLIYRVDEYMESSVSHLSEEEQDQLNSFIRSQCGISREWLRSSMPGSAYLNGALTTASARYHEAKQVLKSFIAHVLSRPILLVSKDDSQKQVAQEVCNFLLAHIRHVQDNRRLTEEKRQDQKEDGEILVLKTFNEPHIGYVEWVHTVATDDTSCPFAFAFFLQLIRVNGKDPLPNVTARYTGQSLSLQLGRMCRQYNDYGSLGRDQEERNLNSLNFPWFRGNTVEDAKRSLMGLAEYERRCMMLSLDQLRTVVEDRTWRAIRAFVDVTDLYGQIYVLKDLTNKMRYT